MGRKKQSNTFEISSSRKMRVARISFATVMENIKHSENWLTVSNYHKGEKQRKCYEFKIRATFIMQKGRLS